MRMRTVDDMARRTPYLTPTATTPLLACTPSLACTTPHLSTHTPTLTHGYHPHGIHNAIHEFLSPHGHRIPGGVCRKEPGIPHVEHRLQSGGFVAHDAGSNHDVVGRAGKGHGLGGHAEAREGVQGDGGAQHVGRGAGFWQAVQQPVIQDLQGRRQWAVELGRSWGWAVVGWVRAHAGRWEQYIVGERDT